MTFITIFFCVSQFNELSKLSIKAISLNKCVTACIGTLNKHAPNKKKYIRGNHQPFMKKEFSKEIMHRTRFRNYFLRNKSDENKIKYLKQQNYSISLLRKLKSLITVRNFSGKQSSFFSQIKPHLMKM